MAILREWHGPSTIIIAFLPLCRRECQGCQGCQGPLEDAAKDKRERFGLENYDVFYITLLSINISYSRYYDRYTFADLLYYM